MTETTPPDIEAIRKPPLGIQSYPVKSRIIRRELVRRYDMCPECGHDLDTGGECNTCDYDAIKEFPKVEREGF